jgi:hypothetical protein
VKRQPELVDLDAHINHQNETMKTERERRHQDEIRSLSHSHRGLLARKDQEHEMEIIRERKGERMGAMEVTRHYETKFDFSLAHTKRFWPKKTESM